MRRITKMILTAVLVLALTRDVNGKDKYYPETGHGCKTNYYMANEFVDRKLVDVCRSCPEGYTNSDPEGLRCHKIKKPRQKQTTMTTTTTAQIRTTTSTVFTTTTAQVLSTTPATATALIISASTDTAPTTTLNAETTAKNIPQLTVGSQKLPESQAIIIIIGVIICILLIILIAVLVFLKYRKPKKNTNLEVTYSNSSRPSAATQQAASDPLINRSVTA